MIRYVLTVPFFELSETEEGFHRSVFYITSRRFMSVNLAISTDGGMPREAAGVLCGTSLYFREVVFFCSREVNKIDIIPIMNCLV